MFIKRTKIRSFEIGLLFRDGEFQGLLETGTHWFVDLFNQVRVDVVSKRTPFFVHNELDMIVKSGDLKDHAIVLDLQEHERALVWIDNRFVRVLPAGLYAYWTGEKNVRVEVVDARVVQFKHAELGVMIKSPMAAPLLDIYHVQRDHAGVLFVDGSFVETLGPGAYAFWRGGATASVIEIDLRETMLEVGGQDIMTADKVTLRLNGVVTYKVADPRVSVCKTEDAQLALYRETQLAMRAVVGGRELDAFLVNKDEVAKELEDAVRSRANELGLQIASVGIRDVILPGDMKELLNRVVEAKRVAEANLISRREETAAMRSQANTAKLLADNPTLMRLRELEVLEKIASSGQLSVVLGDKGLADKITNLL